MLDYSSGSFCRIAFTVQGTTALCDKNLRPVIYPSGTTVYAITNNCTYRCTYLLEGI